MDSEHDLVAAGQAALNTADWLSARACFEVALQRRETPEAHDGLGLALWWLNEIPAAHQHRSTAYLGYKRRGDLRQAAALAAWLAREQVFLNDNQSAMRGWFARAERLLRDLDSCPEHGWLGILRASMLASADELEQVATNTIEIARSFDDSSLEVFALAFSGMARVSLGRVDEGMSALDEAMAVALSGELSNFNTISEVFCVMLSACELAGDVVRTDEWCRAATEFAQRYNCSFLSAYCRTTYGGLLATTGRWTDAEVELLSAIRAFEAGHRALRVHAVLKLADLRVHQGRIEEAEALLAGYEDYAEATVPLARLHLTKGNAQLARAVIEQRLGPASATTFSLHQAPLLLLLVEIDLAAGDIDAARKAAMQLTKLAEQAQSDLLLAQAALAEGQVRRAAGDAQAVERVQTALERIGAYEQSLLAGRARLEMAHILRESDWAGAVTWARAALATFERIGASHDVDEASQLLRQFGVTPRSGPRLQGTLTQREAEVLALLGQGMTNRQIADRLFISPKTAEHHVSQILSKLGARSRAEAAAFAASGAATTNTPSQTA